MSVRCKIVETPAGSDEWLSLRRKRLTASCAADWMAKPTTKRFKDYQQQIAMELLGFEEEEVEAPWYAHGKAMEPFARGAYEFKTGHDVTNDVFCIHPKYSWLGCSPDGMVLPYYAIAIEIKCRAKLETYIDKVSRQRRTGKIDACYRPQVQCQMLVTGLPSIEFIEYYHDAEQRIRKMHVTTVRRDNSYIDQLEIKALEFMTACYEMADKDPLNLAA